ncbi:hypothetical protein CBR_g4555 [Chara braunii]|uniref:Reverse transcriptase n=1 Tax=Chara braunii TaxID=69332 RepID=A0A388KI50_CHABU|nr:hypothetical protein CBR_g4555 [Chara braunii]|eukprot:GBG69725.1 hypothetical protein CBR_g4555 [Chara braunii]
MQRRQRLAERGSKAAKPQQGPKAPQIPRKRRTAMAAAAGHADSNMPDKPKRPVPPPVPIQRGVMTRTNCEAADSQQQAINDRQQDSVDAGIARLSAVESTGGGISDSSPALAAQAKQLDERINHLVASLGDISKFAGTSTISNQLQTLSDRVDQRPAAAAKEWKMPNFKTEKFDDYHKTDPLQWWMAFNAEADVHHSPPLRRMDALYLQCLPRQGQGKCQASGLGKLSTAGSAPTTFPSPRESAALLAASLTSGDTAVVASSRVEFENYAVELVPPLNQPLHVQDSSICAAVPPSDNEPVASPTLLSEDPSTWMRLEDLDPLTVEDFQWLPLASTGSLPTPHCNALMAYPREYLHTAVPPPSTDDGVAVVDLRNYLAKIDREYATQRYVDNDAPLLYIRIQIEKATCNALIDCGATRNYISQDFMARAGLGPRVRRKSQPTHVTLGDGHTQKSIDRCVNSVPVYFAPLACETVSFDILDTKFDMILGMSWLRSKDHPRMSEEELQVLPAQLDDLLAKSWIRPSCLPYGAPILFVRKKNKDLRLCIDYQKLNAQTIKNVGPLPRIDDLLKRLGGAKCFSKLDLKSGYHQIEIQPRDRYKTAFKTRYGHFEWIVMPFGLTNAPTTFQAAMTTEFRDLLDRTVLIYLDDILVYSRTLDEHLEHLRAVLERLRIAKYKANRDKCEFPQQELEYLGHYITPQGIRPLADKVQAWSDLKCTTDVRSFLGLASYYMRFVKRFQHIAAPLSRLQSPLVPFEFGNKARHAFHTLKTALLQAPVLSIYDPTLPTKVTTDASDYGIGAVLEQHDGINWHPVEYFSQKWATDNNPLTYYKTQDTVSSTIGRWMYFIDQFDFTSKHIPSSSNKGVDALSRRPDLCALVHSTFGLDENLQQHFVNGYKSDPGFSTLYADLSSDQPRASNYRIVDDYLLLHTGGKDLLCVPQDRILRTHLLGKYHDSRLAGHLGVARTLARLRQRFHWQDIISDVNQYIQSCTVCHRNKGRHQLPYGELKPLPIPRALGLSIAMDVTSPFPRDRLGHDGILTVVDRLSKYAPFLPCKYHATAPELARLLHTGWFCSHDVPENIVSDRDTHFMSAFCTTVMVESGTNMKPSSARHPQTDGQTVRAHQTAQMMLRTLIRPDKDWVDRLPDIEFAYNTSVHRAIGMTPFELHHGGRKGRIFADILLPRAADIDVAWSPASTRKYRELLAKARANMQKA